jgi:hypothetical protein
MKLFEAIEQKGVEGYFWCNHFEAVSEKDGMTCGKMCNSYAPRNGKSGCCTHYSLKFYEPSEKTLKLTACP